MPTTLKQKVEHFQTLILKTDDFAVPMNYFLDEIANDDLFLDGGRLLNNERIIGIMLAVIESLHQKADGLDDEKAKPELLIYNKRFKFAHGTITIGQQMGMAVYLKDLDMGVAALPSLGDPAMVLFSRFSATSIDATKGAIPVIDRSGYKH
jgi:hypothetical protein